MSHPPPLSHISVRRRVAASLAVFATVGLAPAVVGAQASTTWGYSGVYAKQEQGAVSNAGAYVGSPPGTQHCGYAATSLDPAVGVQQSVACAPIVGASLAAASSSLPRQPLRASASVTVGGATLPPGLAGGYSSYAIASRAIQVGVAALGTPPATVAFFAYLSGSFVVDPLGGPPGVGLAQAAVTMGHNTAPSYAGATFERLHFSSLTAAVSSTASASFAGAVTVASPTTQTVGGMARFELPVVLGTNYFAFELLTLAFAANPGPGAASTSVSAVSDFSNSARIVGLQAFDAQGRDVTGATQFTFVGEDVPLGAPAVVPEPSTLALAATGLLLLLLPAARSRRRA